jgi:hypothetical protein
MGAERETIINTPGALAPLTGKRDIPTVTHII